MPPPRLFPGDEGLGKRNDDRKPGSKSPLAGVWLYRRFVIRKSLRRIVLGLALLIGLYYFFKNMPTDVEPRTAQPTYGHLLPAEDNQRFKSQGVEQEKAGAESKHWFDGPIKFLKLYPSLSAISNTRGTSFTNHNVLFAASSLKSAAILLPLACEMATLKRNHVHFAFMGRDDISMELLKEVNGVKEDCNIWFHDSRPDFLIESSDYRMEVSSSAGLGHINNYMHPQAVIIDNSGVEDEFFTRGFRERAAALDRTIIGLPRNAEQNLRWIIRLDSASLNVWNKISIDIVIHAQPAASGSLLRLLVSLWKADYFQSPPPRLTIELPNIVDEPTRTFLKTYKWPPPNHRAEGSAYQVSLRHRIPKPGLTPEESSIRFLESFWPANPATSHLLVLSPQVELSPLYFHYLKYVILEYKYSTVSAHEKHLMGISLDLPSTYLNGTTAFSPPRTTKNGSPDFESAVPFLWQAPNSNAALYFGDKWTELHSFIGHSLASQLALPNPTKLNSKQVSKTYPSWLEYILSLARIRGYHTLYANLADQAALATIHNELYQPPEEFSGQGGSKSDFLAESGTDLTADPAHHLSLQHKEMALASTSLLNILPSDDLLPSLLDMPLLSWDGKIMDRIEMEKAAAAYSDDFSGEIGGCKDLSRPRPKARGGADDLFCLDSGHN